VFRQAREDSKETINSHRLITSSNSNNEHQMLGRYYDVCSADGLIG
jgi:hypothetical protein